MSQIELEILSPDIIKELEENYLNLNHTKEYIQDVKQKCSELDSEHSFSDQKKDIYLSK